MKRTLLFVCITVLALAACMPTASQYATPEEIYVESYGAPAIAYDAVGGGVDMRSAAEAPMPMPTAGVSYESSSAANGTVERMVIQNVDMSIVVADPKAKMEAVAAMATRMGGFVVSSNLYQTYTSTGLPVPEASIVVRVPAEKLNTALDEIKEGVGEIQYENRSGQDVTSTYVELESRLKNYELAEQQLQEILDRTEDTDSVVQIFNQLVYYREQIEIIKGQMQYYEQAAALSAISLRIVAEETIAPIEVGGWKPEGIARDAIQSLVEFLQGFAGALIQFVLFLLPVLIILAIVIGLPIWGIIKLVRRWNARRNKAS